MLQIYLSTLQTNDHVTSELLLIIQKALMASSSLFSGFAENIELTWIKYSGIMAIIKIRRPKNPAKI